jgi:hypothetical protein
MTNLNLAVNNIMTFVPSGQRYDEALRFYVEIGFTVAWKSDSIAVLKKDNFGFFLQNIQNEWAGNNFMMSMDVENLDDWWKNLSELKLEEKYEGINLRAPEDYPWGKREIHLIDPCGVLWHISINIK